MINSFLDIHSIPLNGRITFSAPSIIDGPPLLTITDLDETIIIDAVSPVVLSESYLWTIQFTPGLDFEVQKHYKVEIIKESTPEYEDNYLIYINNEVSFEDLLKRISGLAGCNLRRHGYIYVRGNVSQYKISIYNTPDALEIAQQGGVDVAFARYKVTALYNEKFNRYETRCEREL